jgi:hypothetical protein
MKPSILLFLAIALLASCTTKRPVTDNSDVPTDPRWSRVDSFAAQGLFASAFSLTDTVLHQARTSGDGLLEFRALMYRARFQQMTGTGADTIINELEARATTAPFPLNALLHSVIGEQYWNYYSDHRWEIMERTARETGSADIATWTQPQFMRKIIAEFKASLADKDSLKAVPVGSVAAVLLDPKAERGLRPTLFDLLAHRALDVFRNTETRIAEPASRFKLDDPGHFALFEEFASLRLGHPDSTHWELQVLKLYQELERAHLSDSEPDALVDNALARLAFVRERSVLSGKDSLYLTALITLESRLREDTCWGEVIMAQARWHEEMGGKYQRLTEGGTIAPPWKWEKKTALTQCDEVIKRFPGSHAAASAANMRAQLLDAHLGLTTEQASLPDAPFKCAITFRNVPKVWARIVKDDWSTGEYLQRNGHGDAEKLVDRKVLREWSVPLPDDGDLNEHVTELAVEGLPFGQYALLVADSATFKPQQDEIATARFWVTRMGTAERVHHGNMDLLVFDRGTGAPKAGVEVVSWVQDRSSGMGEFIKAIEPLSTGADGFMRTFLKGARGRLGWELFDGEDRYITSSTWIPDDYQPEEGEAMRTFLFTDRAIYRPGQPILFKGILTRKAGKSFEVVPRGKEYVELYDANDELVDSLSVVTDEFGAFHGTFTAPTGTLTGTMRIEAEHGQRHVQVEEYKRPTFEVVFDPIAGQPKLGVQVAVSGMARSYAGIQLDGATVQWTVKRSAHMPWWGGWYYRGWLPWGRSTQVAQGFALCDAQGKFTVDFLAEADAQFPRGADPTFHFTIEASATDLNGETQSGSTSLNLGYRSIEISIVLGESLDRSATDSLAAQVLNLNGQRVDVPMDIRVFRLQAPPVPLRDRLWEQPDRFTMTREEHAQQFPQQVYTNENDPLTWTRGAQVMEELGFVPAGRRLPLRGVRTWEVGSYLIEASAKDASGQEVKVSKHFTVFDPGIQNTGFVAQAFHAEVLKPSVEPGEKTRLLLSSALPDGRVLMEVERAGRIVVTRWFNLGNTQQLVELPVLEDDRGGFAVHLLSAERGLLHSESKHIEVPWTNKELKVEWMSFRDKLLPGSEEEWRLKITGSKGEKLAAQLLGAMYDASLDHFVPHEWTLDIWQGNHAQLGWQGQEPFGQAEGQQIYRERRYPDPIYQTYPALNTFEFALQGFRRYRYAMAEAMMDGDAEAANARLAGVNEVSAKLATVEFVALPDSAVAASQQPSASGQPPSSNEQPLRSDFRETAFFFPDLLTDRDGSIVLRFKTPDALTRWKVMGLAHTKDLQLAQFTRETVTQKPLMVVPNLPRFLRSGDRITLTAKINVIEEGRAEGLATLDLFDPFTNKIITSLFGLQANAQSFVAALGESAVAEWTISVPEGVDVCGVRITAQSTAGPRGGIVASDGEERALPVLTDKVLVTESLPLWTSKSGTKTFTLPKLAAQSPSDPQTTLSSRSLKLEYTPNPAWYAVQALPYLMEFPHECAEQVFSRYYANALAAHIVEERPAIKKVFEQWKQLGAEAFASRLEKNQELKSVLLAETPWVVNARDERERKQRIGLLFDMQRMASEEAIALKKLRDMQLPNGAWPWWSGMQESRYITEHIVAGFGHLEKLKAADLRPDGQTQQMLKRAVDWLDADADREYRELVRRTNKDELEMYVPGAHIIHLLYARSFFTRWDISGGAATAIDFYKERLRTTWLSSGLQEQAMAALALHRSGDTPTATAILRSLKERATVSEELGMYWKNFAAGWNWENFPTETHALMIEAFHDVVNDEAGVNGLRRYLLKLKQTTDWRTTKATADACSALLLTGDAWLQEGEAPLIRVGGEEVKTTKAEAGTGAIETSWTAEEIKPAMGTVTITSKADKPSWGALHWQYLERMDKVRSTADESPFSIKKEVLLTEPGDAGPQLIALDRSRKLKAGDKLTIRIELRTDRYVDYVHMKDLRAAGLEPTETLSGYKYQGGLGYYQSIRDASTNFFFDRIAPGTYVFEYSLRVSHAGDFSNGITTAMCMYAPEFSSHSEGVRVKVDGE